MQTELQIQTQIHVKMQKLMHGVLQKVCANWPQKLFKGGPANTLSDMHITRPLFMYKLTKSFSLYSLLILSASPRDEASNGDSETYHSPVSGSRVNP